MQLNILNRKPKPVEQTVTFNETPANVEMPRILEQLRKISALKLDDLLGVSAAQFEKTIRGLFSMIKDLEVNLGDVLNLNAALKTEAVTLRRQNERFGIDNQALKEQLAKLQNATSLSGDLEKRIELAVEEMERYKKLYQHEAQKEKRGEDAIETARKELAKAHEERSDACREIVVLKSKIEMLQSGAGLAVLQKNLEQVQKEKDRLSAELAEAKNALIEIHEELTHE